MGKKTALSTIIVVFIYTASSADPKLKVGEEVFHNGTATENAGNESNGSSNGGIEGALFGSIGVHTSRAALTVDAVERDPKRHSRNERDADGLLSGRGS